MKKLTSIILSLVLVLGTLSGVPKAYADEVTVDTSDLESIISTYFPSVSDSLAEDIVSETPYFLFQVVDYEGGRYYVLDTFSLTDISNWHYYSSNGTDWFWTPYQGNNNYFVTLDNIALSGQFSYNLCTSTSSYSGTQVMKYSFTGSTVFISSTADPRFAQDCYAQQSTSNTVFASGSLNLNPFVINNMTLYFVLTNTNLGNTGILTWTDMVDTNFTDISVSGSSSDPSLNISWAESVYNSQLNYHYSEISLALFFDGVLTFKTFDSLTYPEYFPTSSSINVPFSFLVDVADLANNVDLFSRIKLGEVTLSQYARVNDQSSDVKGSAYTLCNVLLKPFGGPSYDDEYDQGIEPDNIFADRLNHLTPVVPTFYTYEYDGLSNIEEIYPDASAYESPLTTDIAKYVPDWADLTCVSNYSQVDGIFTNDLFSFIDDLIDLYKNWDLYSSSVHSSEDPGEAFSQYCSEAYEQWYFTDVMMFCFFHRTTAWDPQRPQLNQCELIVWFLYTPRYYQKLSDMSVVNTFTDYSLQLNEIATASMNSFYTTYSLYSYLHAKLDDVQRNQINYFGTTTGILGDINDGLVIIDTHLGDLVTGVASIANKLDSTLSVSDSAVLSKLNDILSAINNIGSGGGSSPSSSNEIDTIKEAIEYYNSHNMLQAWNDNLYDVYLTGKVHDWWQDYNLLFADNDPHIVVIEEIFSVLQNAYDSVLRTQIIDSLKIYLDSLSGDVKDVNGNYKSPDHQYLTYFFDPDFEPDSYDGVGGV